MTIKAWGTFAGAAVVWKAVLIVSYLTAGWRVLRGAVQGIVSGRLFDENSLMALASLGAMAIGEMPEAVGVMAFFSVGEYLQHMAVERSRGSIRALMDIRPEYANVMRDGKTERIAPEDVLPGESILVSPGERVPLDGLITSGESFMDTSALTGESMPRAMGPGDEALAGMVNTSGAVTLEVLRPYAQSAVARVLQLVEEASSRKAHTERFITRFSRYYTPAVVALAAAVAVVPPVFVPGQAFAVWLHRALVLLVISCPCALVISIPLGYFAGIGGASRRGVLVKGANFLEALTRVDTVVFDKTGTLTAGSFRVVEIQGENGVAECEVLRLAAHAGARSSHPVSASIRESYCDNGQQGRVIDESAITAVDEVSGMGVRATVAGQRVMAGNDRLLHLENVPHDVCVTDGTVVNVAKDGVLAGRIRMADQVKPGASDSVRRLRQAGVSRIVMLTGDVSHVARQVASEVGIDEYRADLLPGQKVEALEAIMNKQASRGPGHELGRRRMGAVAFVGDGINDAPALTRADVGIAMGGLGSDAAIEAADVVIMDDNPARVADAIEIARRTHRVVIENIVFSLAVKAAVLALGVMGIASMWSAVFADVGVALIAVLNAARAYGGRRAQAPAKGA
ncbi:MAG: heavy metal translocating P-type ATPase [Firmicutes bacterium]|nr:heavy metal translocating P-type ATPase [Bacillota bacterium]